jgi:hypothetical protein
VLLSELEQWDCLSRRVLAGRGTGERQDTVGTLSVLIHLLVLSGSSPSTFFWVTIAITAG